MKRESFEEGDHIFLYETLINDLEDVPKEVKEHVIETLKNMFSRFIVDLKKYKSKGK